MKLNVAFMPCAVVENLGDFVDVAIRSFITRQWSENGV